MIATALEAEKRKGREENVHLRAQVGKKSNLSQGE